jgi:hypothetical protein
MRILGRTKNTSRLFAGLVIGAVLSLPLAGAHAQEGEAVSAGDMSPRQHLQYSEETVDELKAGVRKVLKMVEQAQRDKDVLLLNCLNEKLAGLKALLRVAEQADTAVQEAYARENNDLAAHEFQKIVIARQQAQQLQAEADACVPEVGTSYAGTGRWSTSGPEQDEDEGQWDADPSGYERPPEASPFT